MLATVASGCGDGTTDADALRKIVNDARRDPTTLCDHLAPALLAHYGTTARCERIQRRHPSLRDPQVGTLTVNGSRARATVTDEGVEKTASFLKDDGSWTLVGVESAGG